MAAAWLATWLVGPDAAAHAAYESSTPAFAEELSESPTEISIRFTQELFRREGANSLTLKQGHSDLWVGWELPVPEIRNDDRHVIHVEIDIELSPGRYVVFWTNLSAEDGDSDTGSYPFYVSRSPTNEEIEEDRLIAAELLIAYPGDDVGQAQSDVAAPSVSPTVVRSEITGEVNLGVGPVIWLVVGLVAGLTLVATLVRWWTGLRRAE